MFRRTRTLRAVIVGASAIVCLASCSTTYVPPTGPSAVLQVGGRAAVIGTTNIAERCRSRQAFIVAQERHGNVTQIAAGVPVSIELTSSATLRVCWNEAEFIPIPGARYSVGAGIDTSGERCVVQVHRLLADDSVEPVPIREPPSLPRCQSR